VGRCVFCGREETLSGEDAWPRWLRKVVPYGHAKGYVQRFSREAGTGRLYGATPVRRQKAATRKVRVVCKRNCNNGWMSDLEGDAQPILTPLIRGETATLDEAEQQLVAFWSIKTAMMLEFLHPLRLRSIPAAHYEYVYQRRKPPPKTRISLRAHDGREVIRTRHLARGHFVGTDGPPNVYTVVIIAGRMIIDLIGWLIPDDELVSIDSRWTPTGRRIWPPGPGSITYPADEVIASADLWTFCNEAVGRLA
jgi:hypothetical protein